MKTVFASVVLAIAAAVAVGQESIPLELPYKADFSYLEKMFSLKIGKFGVTKEDMGIGRIGFLAEFEKDLAPGELAELRTIFAPLQGRKGEAPRQKTVKVVYFDEDNVVIATDNLSNVYTRGEITGVKGDAFRVQFNQPQIAGKERIARAQLRPVERKTVTQTLEKKTVIEEKK